MSTLSGLRSCLLAPFIAGTLTAQSNDKTPLNVISPNGQIALQLFDAIATMCGGDLCGRAASPVKAMHTHCRIWQGTNKLAESPLSFRGRQRNPDLSGALAL
jgi:hypothetical protein